MQFKVTTQSCIDNYKSVLRMDVLNNLLEDRISRPIHYMVTFDVEHIFKKLDVKDLDELMAIIESGINGLVNCYKEKLLEQSMTDKWMQDVKPKKGALRKELGAKKGKDIPAKALEKATHSKNPLLKKRAVLAETYKKANKKKK